uniref:Endo-1,4-beta-xylanase n=1 Tax=termite gut metagenome TaxID=433724 RepID=UPI000BA4E5CE
MGEQVVKPTDERIIDPSTANTQLTGGVTYNTTSGGNKPLAGSPYGYETWIDTGGGVCSLTWYGADQGGGAAFKATWTNPHDFLGRLGYFWNENKPYSHYENIYCGFNYTRSGRKTAGDYSYIGIYGWSRNPSASNSNERLIEYYIVEDWFGNQWQADTSPMGINTTGGTVMGSFTCDGSSYQIIKNTRVNQPSIEGDKTFVQYFSIRQSPRKSGTISITCHFKKWEKLGMKLGDNMYECKFLIEAGAGEGFFDARLIQFYRADNEGNILQITPLEHHHHHH